MDYKTGTETGIAGSIYYDDSRIGFTKVPQESINYLNSHDNLILADKFKMVYQGMDSQGNKRLNKLAHAILFTSQGIPFIHGGNEFLRSKSMISNSYKSPSRVNAMDWSLMDKHKDLYDYIKDLITLRNKYDVFTMEHRKDIREKLKFLDHEDCIILYTIKNSKNDYLLIGHNANINNTIITRSVIRKHLRDSYNAEIYHMKLYKLLDIKGLRSKALRYDLHSIEIEAFSSVVFRVKID